METSKSGETDEQFGLGSDLLAEICSRMPAKAAIKVSSLSKSQYGLLSNPFFVETQSIRSSLYDGGFFLQTYSHLVNKPEFHVLPSKDGEPQSSSFGIPERSLSFLKQLGFVLSSSQGLVLVKSESDVYGRDRFLICNPATRSCALLPFPDMPLESNQFIPTELFLECRPRNLGETHSSSFDYTIVAPLPDDDPTIDYTPSVTDFAVYRNGKWEEDMCHVNIEGGQIRTETPVAIFRGPDRRLVVHYMCDSEGTYDRRPIYKEPYLVAIDLESKALSRTFPLPKKAWNFSKDRNIGSLYLIIFKWRWLGSDTVGLARTDDGVFRVWVLEDYDRGRWRLVVSKTYSEIGVSAVDSLVLACCVVDGTRFLFATRQRVFVYEMDGGDDSDDSRLKLVAEHGCKRLGRLVVIPYANTLRPVCGHEQGLCGFTLPDS